MDDAERLRANKIIRILRKHYPNAKCSLDYRNPFELLVATILSAQCTDERVNKVTRLFFKKFKIPKDASNAPLTEIEDVIRSTGFFRNKARAIRECATEIVRNHNGEVPGDIETLTKLRGVGRKTANVILGNAFGIPSIVVDTHVKRLSRRIGLSRQGDPEKIEQDLMRLLPKKEWTHFSHLLIAHGREICTARRAYCEICPISKLCPKIGV